MQDLACPNRADITNGASVFLRLTFSLTLGDKLSCRAKRLMPRSEAERGPARVSKQEDEIEVRQYSGQGL